MLFRQPNKQWKPGFHWKKYIHCLFLKLILFCNWEHANFVAYFGNQWIHKVLWGKVVLQNVSYCFHDNSSDNKVFSYSDLM